MCTSTWQYIWRNVSLNMHIVVLQWWHVKDMYIDICRYTVYSFIYRCVITRTARRIRGIFWHSLEFFLHRTTNNDDRAPAVLSALMLVGKPLQVKGSDWHSWFKCPVVPPLVPQAFLGAVFFFFLWTLLKHCKISAKTILIWFPDSCRIFGWSSYIWPVRTWFRVDFLESQSFMQLGPTVVPTTFEMKQALKYIPPV